MAPVGLAKVGELVPVGSTNDTAAKRIGSRAGLIPTAPYQAGWTDACVAPDVSHPHRAARLR